MYSACGGLIGMTVANECPVPKRRLLIISWLTHEDRSQALIADYTSAKSGFALEAPTVGAEPQAYIVVNTLWAD
jgi:hypothetical protein